MTPKTAIAMLDNQIAMHGQNVTVQRITNGITESIDCPAFVRNYRASEIIPGKGIEQGDTLAIFSPTDLGKMQWAGLRVGDQTVPRRSDKVIAAGIQRNVEASNPFYFPDAENPGARIDILVRVEVQLRGG